MDAATDRLKLGLMLGYWSGPGPGDQVPLAQAAEAAGFDSVWTAESYGSDVFTPLAWIGAHTSRIRLGTALTQMSARTPAATAMTAMTLDRLSGGRMILGLGVSGPQVVEGWYGMPFPKPLARTREYVGVLRDIWRREEPVTNDGEHYPLPYPGGTGLGKPLKANIHPLRPDIPVYLGAEGPKNVALAAEIADGWLPLFFHAERSPALYADSLAGAAADFDVACPVSVVIDDDVRAAIARIKPTMALYIGGMGAKGTNFHLDVVARMGFEEEARRVQELYLAGDRAGAVEAVPDELCDGIALCGPLLRVLERLELWRSGPVRTLLLSGVSDPASMRALVDAAG
ncbi:LLM class F420-dependent oxidoreductase [Blastococcus sp. CCUG 61487]|uniref:LLM class F420-dependent oxidoreductase n=1 Tax=Blastococcus sp. CCUG 61487 TaxID=1840703 RepID=UPI0010BFBD9B|nr:LLM class F420-dependent oxidoreductase [Blastococcus sp. CCUG 61487]TKJ31710.1 LLM class F420-dependent oxidoreductase [Blastococcus sp. CCUG 61487]